MRILCLMLLSLMPAHAYLRSTTREGNPLRRTDSDNIRFRVNRGVAAGAPDSDGRPMITTDSDPFAALQSALSAWNGVASSAARFAPLQVTDAENSGSDGQPVIVFLDTAEARSIVGSALAVARTFFFSDGRITDSDILFNPRVTSGGARTAFSTTLAEGTFDLQSVATHELGHALGAGHSGLIGATMFPSTPSAASFQSQLSTDDIAFVTDAYPSPSAASSFGTISGVVSMSGTGPLGGALVVAVDADSGVTVGALSSQSTGTFAMRAPRGRYQIYAEPMGGAVSPGNFSLSSQQVSTEFQPTFLGTRTSPTLLEVTAGGTARADIAVTPGISTIEVEFIGAAAAGGSGDSPSRFSNRAAVRSGEAADLFIIGSGVDDTIAESDIKLLGGGVALRPGSLRVERGFTINRVNPLRLTLDIRSRTEPALSSIVISKGQSTVSWSGSLLITPAPSFTAAGVGNVASYKSGGVSPGEIVAIFGSNIGPVGAELNGGFDVSSGRLPGALAGVRVTFDGTAAPAFFVSAGQVNVQVPYEVAGRATTRAVIRYRDLSTSAVTLPVVGAKPGIFTLDGTRAIVVHPDGSLNGASNAVAKGTAILLFATGSGVTDPPVATGRAASSTTLSSARGAALTIGGTTAQVLFAGPAPGFTGLTQINAIVPAGAPSGAAVPVVFTVQGAASVSSTMSIR